MLQARPLLAISLLFAANISQAALIEMYDTNLGGTSLDSVAEAEAIIAASGGADYTTNLDTIDFEGDSFPGPDFGSPPDDRFVMRVIGIIDTSAYDQLFMRHDDGFTIRIGGIDFFTFDANTAPRNSASGPLADNGLQTFEMIFWDQGGAQVARLTSDPDFPQLVNIADPRSVSEPGSLALLGLGLIGVALRRRRRLA